MFVFGLCVTVFDVTLTSIDQLRFSSSQDYHWPWRSFLTSGFTAVYFLVYAIHYFFSKLQITGLASTILYFGYTMIMALIFFLFTGRYIQKKVGLMHFSLWIIICLMNTATKLIPFGGKKLVGRFQFRGWKPCCQD